MSIIEAPKTKATRTTKSRSAGGGQVDPDLTRADAIDDAKAQEYRDQDARASAAHANDDRAQRVTTSTDIFGDYLHKIGVSPLLTAEQEVSLARDIEIGVLARDKLEHTVDDPTLCRELAWLVHAGEVAKRRFIESNLRLVVSIAKRYAGRGVPVMDLVQDGNLGLIRAVEKYDYASGYKFSTYGTWWIRQSIHRGLADKSRMIRIPVHTVEKMNMVKRMRRELLGELEREPTDAELANAAQLSASDIAALQRLDNEPISLYTPIGDGTGDISEIIIDDDTVQPEDYAVGTLQHADIEFFLDSLPEREHRILNARFGLTGEDPLTLNQIAAIEGVTKERIRQLQKRALRLMNVAKLQRYLMD
ncbi:RNA polymerase sigma factor RpoD/SigA [Leifsonia sp. A12D58]|uniref:sigma-70 family RNA polymerase sigma factor n=1 Tax=Leifsonia sp. A12D58 TaxID=3397674 RepID=UPI0039DFB192